MCKDSSAKYQNNKERLQKKLVKDIKVFLKKKKIYIYIFNHEYLYTAYADDTMFFLKNQSSVKNALNDIESFSVFSGLHPNLDKCEIPEIGVLMWHSVV